jgi:AraC family transcriptional regulator
MADPDKPADLRLLSVIRYPIRDESLVRFAPPLVMSRKLVEWPGLRSEVVTATQRTPFQYRFQSDHHLLVAVEHAERVDGESSLEGLPKSTLHSLSGRLTFVPAGHSFDGWQEPSVLTRVNFFYIDPNTPLLQDEQHFADVDFRPRLLFHDTALWQIAARLKAEALSNEAAPSHYGEALLVLLGHELIRLDGATRSSGVIARGGLSGWQQRRVSDYIEDHLSEEVRLSTLAGLVDLSPYHFARAFKQSFGVPPHRYHVLRRIERAKTLLAQADASVTGVAMTVGFAETSSFSAAFRRMTGTSPRDFRRGLA